MLANGNLSVLCPIKLKLYKTVWGNILGISLPSIAYDIAYIFNIGRLRLNKAPIDQFSIPIITHH